MGAVPLVDFGLQAVALGKQCRILWGHVSHDGIKAAPEVHAGYTSARQNLFVNKLVKRGGYLESVNRSSSGHVGGD